MADITDEVLKGLYSTALKGLELSFDESIYAIAFELQDEIRVHGKEAVFAELGMTKNEMRERVEHCLNKLSKDKASALRLVLGDWKLVAGCEEGLNARGLKYNFWAAIDALRKGDGGWRYVNYKYLLLQGDISRTSVQAGENIALTQELYTQIQQLMEEVRYYNERRDLALARIEELLSEIKQRQDCPKDFDVSADSQDLCTIELSGSIAQIAWPYRSLKIIHGLGLQTVSEVVEYFCDFKHFVKSEDLTLMEWSVITSILHKRDLLPRNEFEFFGLCDGIESLDLSVRLFNNLKRGGIDQVDDIVSSFAYGATAGWDKLKRIRNYGRRSFEELFQKLSIIVIVVDDTLCYPTMASHIRALDFGASTQCALGKLGLKTIGDLVNACQNQNRFLGLRYLDYDLYNTAMSCLREYGIFMDSCDKTPL